jgi:carboxypeptidase PM20D1
MVLDEGGVIGDRILPDISGPVALGIAEKGFVTIQLSARVAGGHSSLPTRQSAVGILSAAVARLEQTQMGARFEGRPGSYSSESVRGSRLSNGRCLRISG